ncbi:acetyl-CoA synthetase [Halogeometricum sp. S1BR25-6]|uniref:Acetyl-CoA synthetase n=1 Tax=Halogeometricum salsisoli TaxID=2950536 RepID=A0ABU2GDL9_9EURY|nr:AMP-binding protein [Halogeometricum sp. S1BR25-6]MDS0298901.1 acetyl-CoA synthetase [Halogeometricum sp. S1BR25-6]
MTPDAPPSRPADPTVLGDLVARDRRTSAPALRARDAGRSYSYYDFVTTTYKAGNVLRYLGVRGGETVAVAPDPLPEPVLAFYGAAQLGAATTFHLDPTGSAAPADAPRATLVGVDREGEFDLPPGCKLAVYGGSPERPETTHWEQEVWSENPAVHPATVAADDAALRADGRTYSHAELLDAAATAVESGEMMAGEEVVVRDSLERPGAVAAGLVAPVLVGAVVTFPDSDTVGDVAVGDGPEGRSVSPADVL